MASKRPRGKNILGWRRIFLSQLHNRHMEYIEQLDKVLDEMEKKFKSLQSTFMDLTYLHGQLMCDFFKIDAYLKQLKESLEETED